MFSDRRLQNDRKITSPASPLLMLATDSRTLCAPLYPLIACQSHAQVLSQCNARETNLIQALEEVLPPPLPFPSTPIHSLASCPGSIPNLVRDMLVFPRFKFIFCAFLFGFLLHDCKAESEKQKLRMAVAMEQDGKKIWMEEARAIARDYEHALRDEASRVRYMKE